MVATRNESTLRADAEAIWRAGVNAVDSSQLVRDAVCVDDQQLVIHGDRFPLSSINHVVVVGAGKAGAGMVIGIEQAVAGTRLAARLRGWVNVPANCLRSTTTIHLHPARPAGVNEPTEQGVVGAEQILRIVETLQPNDLCIVLLSGGGSALLPAPVNGLTLHDKQQITRQLMQSGGSIEDLNCVRKQLSRIKGGGLARVCRSTRLVTLIISDVVGDPLDVIASGPTVEDSTTARDALDVIDQYVGRDQVPRAVLDCLTTRGVAGGASGATGDHRHHVIGNNAMALNAASNEARKRGYAILSLGSENRGEARDEGRHLAQLAVAIRDRAEPVAPPVCILSGGEPVVTLTRTDQPRRGGRNQELIVAALDSLLTDGMDHICLLSGGTDGEDGPTDAAGGVIDAATVAAVEQQQLHLADYLAINNSYPLLQSIGALLITGPTHTNVMDLRVGIVR